MFCSNKIAKAITEGFEKMSQATDRLTASVGACTVAVEALIARIPAPAPPVDEAPIVAAADALDALTAKANAAIPAVTP